MGAAILPREDGRIEGPGTRDNIRPALNISFSRQARQRIEEGLGVGPSQEKALSGALPKEGPESTPHVKQVKQDMVRQQVRMSSRTPQCKAKHSGIHAGDSPLVPLLSLLSQSDSSWDCDYSQ